MIAPAARGTILGFGSRWRCDDAVGLLVVEALARRGLDAEAFHGDGLMLAERLRALDSVVVVDAMRSGAAPGTIVEIDAAAQPLPRGVFPTTTHVFGVAEGLELARRLGWLPAVVSVVGVEGARFGYGGVLTAEVEAALPRVVERVAARAAHEGPVEPACGRF